jgi:branched-chain amino acid aminotransferase
VIWLGGRLLPDGEARIDPADRGFTLGDGVFETIRAAGGVPCHAERHLARLRRGAALLGIPVPFDDATLAAALHAVLAASYLPDAALRLTLTRGPARRGLLPPGEPRPTVLITAQPLPPALPPAHVIISRITRRNEFSPLCAIKSLNYLDSILARNEAAAYGADDALLLNTAGALAGATAATLLLRLDGAWVTPPLQDGALAGIARERHLDQGLIAERRLYPADATRAEAACLLTSLAIRPIRTVEDTSTSVLAVLPVALPER